jgi:Zn-dependent protease/predicted transcriptional regulator
VSSSRSADGAPAQGAPAPTPASPQLTRRHSRWAWTIGRVAGIDIQVHATFLLLLAWVAFAEYKQVGTAAAAINGVIFVLALFGSVVLHELGHALTAAHYGVHTRAILLLPIGGVSELEEIPREPRKELAIAIAGPLVTVAIVVVLYAALRATGTPLDAAQALNGTGPFLVRLMWINVVLAVFNLLPAFPMDGGRVLRALIAMRTDYVTATSIAARIGQAFALVFGLLGLLVLGNVLLVLVAFFVWIGAAGEAASVRVTTAIEGVPVARVMTTDVRTLSADEPLSTAANEVVAGFQNDFPVMRDHTVAGVLTRGDLLRALAAGRQGDTVGDIMHRTFAATTPDEMLSAALTRLQECRCRTLPVLRDGSLAGLLTMDRIGEFVTAQSAAHHGQWSSTPSPR